MAKIYILTDLNCYKNSYEKRNISFPFDSFALKIVDRLIETALI